MDGDRGSGGSEPPGVRGTLHLCHTAPEGGADPAEACRHVSEFVNGPDSFHLADNDLRGFLDGRVASPWNQAGQSYTRAGRYRYRKHPPEHGEDELFRTLQRWTGIDLPPGSKIRGARLVLHAHTALPRDTLLYLYAVRRDWNPGTGGVRKDNVSVPKKGEVWWGEARSEEEAWGLPGVGFAADGPPDADTPAQPLALARCGAGAVRIELGDRRLAEYVERRIHGGRPLLFLLKLSDQAEDDAAGSVIKLLSGEYGHERGSERRPRLVLEWTPPPGTACLRTDVFLEYGRETVITPAALPEGTRIWASFRTDEGFEPPTLQYREVSGEEGAPPPAWHPLSGPVRSSAGEIEIRVLAARNPVVLGDAFSARFRDTWVVSAAAEDQRLEWRFTSPSGVTQRIEASYEGGRAWNVAFAPDEIGRWRMRWSHRFAGPDEVGPEEAFDVVAPNVEAVGARLRELGERIEGSAPSGPALERALGTLLRLERAGMRGLSPTDFRSSRGAELRAELDRTREILRGKPLPPRDRMTSIPLREEAGGRRFAEPIPRCGAFRREDYEPPPPWTAAVARSLRRWRRRLGRQAARLLPNRRPPEN